MYYTKQDTSIFHWIKGLFSTSDYTSSKFSDFFWTKKKANACAAYLREQVDELMKRAHDLNEVAGYRGYVLDTEKAVIVLKTSLYIEEDPCAIFISEYVAAISPEYVDPSNLLIVVEAVKFGEAEKSDADMLDDAMLDLPKSTVLKQLKLTSIDDILDILRSHGTYEATYGQAEEQDIDQ